MVMPTSRSMYSEAIVSHDNAMKELQNKKLLEAKAIKGNCGKCSYFLSGSPNCNCSLKQKKVSSYNICSYFSLSQATP